MEPTSNEVVRAEIQCTEKKEMDLATALGTILLFFFPIGTILGLIIIAGSAKSVVLACKCGHCGNPVADNQVKICPTCHAQLVWTQTPQLQVTAVEPKKPTPEWQRVIVVLAVFFVAWLAMVIFQGEGLSFLGYISMAGTVIWSIYYLDNGGWLKRSIRKWSQPPRPTRKW